MRVTKVTKKRLNPDIAQENTAATLSPPTLTLVESALAASSCGVTIADARTPDRPLLYVNAAFVRMTGYTAEEALGKNCRFLQGEDRTQPALGVLRAALQRGEDCQVTLQNFRKDGTPFWNELTVSPIRDEAGDVTHFIGVQTDITRRKEAEDALQKTNAELERRVSERTLALQHAYETTLEGWVKALDMRDHETEGHTQRVTALTVQLALAYGVDEAELVHIRRGALLHDIGKIGIPDQILLKPGKLNELERKAIEQHPIYAYEWLSSIPYLRPALAIPYYHHEKWDGTGYPFGLKGEDIPLAARLFAVVDVWDALRSDRPYRKAWSRAETVQYLRSMAGSHFDPHAVEVFLLLQGEQETEAPEQRRAA